LKALLQDDTFKGKKDLEWLIWRNTAIPMFKVGDFVKVTDRSCRIWGHPIVDFNARVKSIHVWKIEQDFQYELEFTCKLDGKKDYTTRICIFERNLKYSARTDTDINYLGESKSEHCESITPIGLGI
jgi:hypothetical protein